MMNKTSSKLFLALKWAVLLIVLALIYLPLFMIIVYSFSASKTVGGPFGDFTFVLYKNLFSNTTLLSALKNTLIIGVSSAAIATVLGTTADGLQDGWCCLEVHVGHPEGYHIVVGHFIPFDTIGASTIYQFIKVILHSRGWVLGGGC